MNVDYARDFNRLIAIIPIPVNFGARFVHWNNTDSAETRPFPSRLTESGKFCAGRPGATFANLAV
ncbi:hypothetical protein [Sphingomonas sp. dw_22]|uniref:hypothetical protein n=1 Tax=Sphingomonas sp. dw_22 TaxID=2721175 RepID=UPI001BD59D83|nr:hypothetical protein [Sphingomonas sp. dw_22]